MRVNRSFSAEELDGKQISQTHRNPANVLDLNECIRYRLYNRHVTCRFCVASVEYIEYIAAH